MGTRDDVRRTINNFRENIASLLQPPGAKLRADHSLRHLGFGPEFIAFDQGRGATFSSQSDMLLQRRGNVTPQFLRWNQEILDQLPPFIRKMLGEFDTQIMVGRSVFDIDPVVAREVRKELEGRTMADGSAGAFFPGSRIAGIFEDKTCGNRSMGECKSNIWRASAHEVGHAIDKFLGYPSESEKFRSAYKMDMEGLIQKGHDLALKYGVEPNKIDQYTDEDLFRKGLGDDTIMPSAFRKMVKGEILTGKILSLDKYVHDNAQAGGLHDSPERAMSELFAELTMEHLVARHKKGGKDKDLPSSDRITSLMPNCAAFVRGTMENLERYYSFAPRPKVVEFTPQSFF